MRNICIKKYAIIKRLNNLKKNGRSAIKYRLKNKKKVKTQKILNSEENQNGKTLIKCQIKQNNTSNEWTTIIIFLTRFMQFQM